MNNLDGLIRIFPELESLIAQIGSGLRAHLAGVAGLAADLARRNGLDPRTAALAGYLHDLLKPAPKRCLLAMMRLYRVRLDPASFRVPSIWHGPVVAGLARFRLRLRDPAVLAAIHWHSTGRFRQGRLERVLFVADFCAPDRDFPEARRGRKLAGRDLDGAARYVVASKLAFLYDRGIRPHPAAYGCWRGLVS